MRQRIWHGHDAQVASNKVVNFPTLTLNSLACCVEIKLSREQDNVRENFEEFLHGFEAVHSHQRMNHVRRLSDAEIGSSIVNFDPIGHRFSGQFINHDSTAYALPTCVWFLRMMPSFVW